MAIARSTAPLAPAGGGGGGGSLVPLLRSARARACALLEAGAAIVLLLDVDAGELWAPPTMTASADDDDIDGAMFGDSDPADNESSHDDESDAAAAGRRHRAGATGGARVRAGPRGAGIIGRVLDGAADVALAARARSLSGAL